LPRLSQPRFGADPSVKGLHVLGIIKKVAHTYRYYLTRIGRAASAAACSLTRFNSVTAMAASH
jgi:hypothetical protein